MAKSSAMQTASKDVVSDVSKQVNSAEKASTSTKPVCKKSHLYKRRRKKVMHFMGIKLNEFKVKERHTKRCLAHLQELDNSVNKHGNKLSEFNQPFDNL